MCDTKAEVVERARPKTKARAQEAVAVDIFLVVEKDDAGREVVEAPCLIVCYAADVMVDSHTKKRM